MELDDTDRERKRAKKEKHSSKDRSHRAERKACGLIDEHAAACYAGCQTAGTLLNVSSVLRWLAVARGRGNSICRSSITSTDLRARPCVQDSDRDKGAGARERGKERDSVKDRDRCAHQCALHSRACEPRCGPWRPLQAAWLLSAV